MDVDGFNNITITNFDSAIGIDLSDGERSLSWHIHFWLAVAFIRIKDNQDLTPSEYCLKIFVPCDWKLQLTSVTHDEQCPSQSLQHDEKTCPD